MTCADEKSLDRWAELLIVQYQKGKGSPPQFEAKWKEIYDAKVESIVDNAGATPSEATFWFPDCRWDGDVGLDFGDKIRILAYHYGTVLFEGFIVKTSRQFSGGTEQGGKFERLGFFCLDYRWLMAAIAPIFGQYARSKDDYNNFGKAAQSPKEGSFTFFSGRRCVFNAGGTPNADPGILNMTNEEGTAEIHIFANPNTNSDNAHAWTAGEIVQYILIVNQAYPYFPYGNPADLTGLDNPDWNQVLNNISVEGLNTAAALQFVCKQIGWSYRIDYNNQPPAPAFYKAGQPAMEHSLFAPAPAMAGQVNNDVKTAVEAGKIMLWAAQYEKDITSVVNNPFFLGSPLRFEFTAELVPAWLDEDLTPDTENDNANLFFYEADLTEVDNPNSFAYFKNYHTKGSDFRRDVGRIWALNESGRYTNESTCDRGMPFDFADVLPAEYIKDANGKSLFGPFDRQLLPCLTKEKMTNNSVGIIAEFSFDGGSSWHKIPAAITSLRDQCGIYIAEPNLAEIKPEGDDLISGGDLDGEDLNYWTSLCADKLDEEHIFKDEKWNTRLRVTASVQLDQRLGGSVNPLHSGSPFWQRDLFDFSGDYHYQKRIEEGTGASIYAGSQLTADNRDGSLKFKSYIEYLRNTLQDASISGQFTLERLWLGTFKLGDCIKKIEGRERLLRVSYGSQTMYPEIIQIIFLPQKQKMKLITRDLRFSEKK